MKRYALESNSLARLIDDRRELLAYARTLRTAEEMRLAREDLYKSSRVYRAPSAERPLELSVDADGVARIPVVGELTPSADPCGAFSMQGETEYGFIRAALAEADARPDIISIALDVNSPGGYIDGVDATAQAIAAVSKPVTAYVDGMACSAAYWLASQADRIVALSPASEIGSIGVACEEYDDREALAAEGVAHRVYTSTDAPDKRPDTSTEEGRAKIVAELDALHAVFVRRVSEGRHVAPDKVNSDFGKGGVYTAEKALSVGMIDEVRGSHLSRPSLSSAGVASSAAATSAAISSEEVHMDLNTLKAEHPDLSKEIDDAMAAKFAEGVTAERQRREQLLGLKGVNAEGDKAVDAAIKDGLTFADASPLITTAIVRGTGGENAPAVGTKPADTASGSDGLTADDIAAANLVGMTLDEYRKYAVKE